MSKQGQSVSTAADLGLVSLSDAVNHLIGAGPHLIEQADCIGKSLILHAENKAWRVKLGDHSAAGAAILTELFDAAGDWVLDAEASIAGGVLAWTGDQAADAEAALDILDGDEEAVLVPGKLYKVVYTIAGRTAGSITASLGGTDGAAQSADAAVTEYIQAGADADIAFIVDDAFDGTVTQVTISPAELRFAAPTLEVMDGSGAFKIIQGEKQAFTAMAALTLVGEDSDAILTYYWI